jgi:hypothetical protein
MQCSPDIIQANAGVLFHAVELQAFNAMLEQCWSNAGYVRWTDKLPR